MSLKDRRVDYNYIIYCYTVAKSPQPNIFYVLILSIALIHMLFKVSLALPKKHRRDSHFFQHECSL